MSSIDDLRPILGHWITEGETVATSDVPSVRVVTSDVYLLQPPGTMVLHTAYGLAGGEPGGGIEVITVNPEGDGFLTHFFEANATFTRHTLRVEGTTWSWDGETRRSRCELSADGRTLKAHHERLDCEVWVPSIDVVLRKS